MAKYTSENLAPDMVTTAELLLIIKQLLEANEALEDRVLALEEAAE